MKIEKTTKTVTTYTVNGKEHLTVEDAVKAFVYESLCSTDLATHVAKDVANDWKHIRQILNEAAKFEFGEVIMLINEQTTEEQKAEILLILQEECAEVIQAVAKCKRFGFESKHPFDPNSKTNIDHLTEELGDLLAMINLCMDSGLVDPFKLDQARAAKGMKLAKWSSIFHKIN